MPRAASPGSNGSSGTVLANIRVGAIRWPRAGCKLLKVDWNRFFKSSDPTRGRTRNAAVDASSLASSSTPMGLTIVFTDSELSARTPSSRQRGRSITYHLVLYSDPATSMTLVSRFCHMSSVRSTSDGRGPVTRKRVPDREEQGKPSKDARRGRCHPLE